MSFWGKKTGMRGTYMSQKFNLKCLRTIVMTFVPEKS